MIQPQSLDVNPGGPSAQRLVWAILGRSGKYLAIPDHRYPGRRPVRFFTSQVGAVRVINTALEVQPVLAKQELVAVQVDLLMALRKVRADKTPPTADSFVVLNPDEVFELVTYLRKKAIKSNGPQAGV